MGEINEFGSVPLSCMCPVISRQLNLGYIYKVFLCPVRVLYISRNGAERSGLYTVIAAVLEMLQMEQKVNIPHVLLQQRSRRPQIIQTFVSASLIS